MRLFILLAVMLLIHMARAQKECFEVTSCVECLSLSQCPAWTDATGGRCLESCGNSAEVDCYSPQFFPNLSDEEICNLADRAVTDAKLCANQTNCGDCIGTSLTDGNCQWFPEKGECASICDPDLGCGEQTTCPQVNCSALSTCGECLSTPECGGWAPVAGCLESCNMIADASCYSINTFPDQGVNETCQIAANDQANAQLCSSQTNCGDCVGTTLSNGNTTCQWFVDGGYCASGCDMNGCGETTCQAAAGVEDNECSGLSCQDCLATTCAWAPGVGCLSSCDITGTTCFNSGDSEGTDLCDASCDRLLSCQDCLASICAWAPPFGCVYSCDVITDTSCFNSGDLEATDMICSGSSENPTSFAETVSVSRVFVLALIGSAVVAY